MWSETIRPDLTTAMKARDALRVRSLRAIIAAVQEAQVAGSEARTLNDDEVQQVIAAQVKRRVEAADRIASRTGGQIDARQLGPRLLPGALGGASAQAISRAESPAQGLALLLVAPEFLRR